MKKKKRVFLMLLLALAVLIVPGFYSGLQIRRYTFPTPKAASALRLVLVTDLHSCACGENGRELIAAIDGEKPDLILLGGDIFDDVLPGGNAEALLRNIGSRYPCYYVTGNHEYWAKEEVFRTYMNVLEECGVIRLENETVQVSVNGNALLLSGIDDPYAFVDSTETFRSVLKELSPKAGEEQLTILLSHRPELFEVYCGCGYDVILSGHAHGGQLRIPLLVNGIYLFGHLVLNPRSSSTSGIVLLSMFSIRTKVPRSMARIT